MNEQLTPQDVEQTEYQFNVGNWQFHGDENSRYYCLITNLPKDPEELSAFTEELLVKAWGVYSDKVNTEHVTDFNPNGVIQELMDQNYFQNYSMGDITLSDVRGRLRLETDGNKVRGGFYFTSEYFDKNDLVKLMQELGNKAEVS